MTDMHETVLRAAVWRAVKDRAAELEAEATRALAGMEVGDRVSGRYGGVLVAQATRAKGAQRVRVTDQAGLAAWVQERWPTEVETTITVNPAFLEVLKGKAKRLGALIDDDGEVCPHMEIVVGDPSVRLTVDKDVDMAAVISALAAAGELAIYEVPELTA